MEVKNEEHLKKMYIDYLCNLMNQLKYHKVRVFTSLNRMDITYYGRKWYQKRKVDDIKVEGLDEMAKLLREICIEIYKESVPVSWAENYIETYDKWIEHNFTNEIRLY
jgi:hypothetical protein